MKLKRFTIQFMAAGLIAVPLMTQAAGLGSLSVTSALGQPLIAEIELMAADKAELDSLAANLASEQAFRDARIEMSPVLSTLRFSVQRKANGKAVLKVTSSRPVNDPFIDMLIELNWASGRLVREYTVLLDPPGAAVPQKIAPVVVTPARTVLPPPDVSAKPADAAEPAATVQPVPVPAEPGATAKPVPEPAVPANTAVPQHARPQSKPSESTPPAPAAAGKPAPQKAAIESVNVKRGDTMAAIAKRVRPEGIALEQALIGLYRENTAAFSGKNINRLKAGKTLKVPTYEAFAAIDRLDARREIKLQTADWQAYRQKLADAVTGSPVANDKTEPGQSASGKISSKVEDGAKPASPAPKDVLKLSKVAPPAPQADVAARQAAAAKLKQAQLQAQEEDATAREKALNESSSRVAALEKQVTDMQALVKMKEEAARQAQLKPQPETAKNAPPITATPVAPAKPVAPVKSAAVLPGDTSEPVTPWYALLAKNPLYWAAGLALIGLGGLLWWMLSGGRRRKPVTAFEDSLLTGGDMQPNTVVGAGAASGGSINTGDTSFLTDFSQAGLGTIDTHDVDPIAEAEVYMAYGRDAQAEEILKEAILKNPDRHEIRMKLLEIYAARRNTQAFESTAGELYAALGNKSNSLWNKAAEMGRSIDPINPLYGGVESSTSASSAPQVIETVAATPAIAGGAMAFDTLSSDTAPQSVPEPPPAQSAGKTESHSAPAATVADAHTNELDFDLSGLDISDATSNDLDLDLGLNDDNGPDSKFDFSGLDLDLGDAVDSELDEVGTKLDLARAYVEMGDKEGAREILNEVIAEGNDKQKSDAQGVLSSLV